MFAHENKQQSKILKAYFFLESLFNLKFRNFEKEYCIDYSIDYLK